MNQRHVKFRVWDKKVKQMFYDISSEKLCLGLNGRIYVSITGEDVSDNFVLMQYTGLTDAHGKEIYEDDIIEFTDKKQNELYLCRVKYGEYGDGEYVENLQCWIVDNTPLSSLVISGGTMIDHVVEHPPIVIGNIYENPELTKITLIKKI